MKMITEIVDFPTGYSMCRLVRTDFPRGSHYYYYLSTPRKAAEAIRVHEAQYYGRKWDVETLYTHICKRLDVSPYEPDPAESIAGEWRACGGA